jgi:hypothetical protein
VVATGTGALKLGGGAAFLPEQELISKAETIQMPPVIFVKYFFINKVPLYINI